MKHLTVAVVLLVALAACAGPGGVSPSGGLMYQVPETPTLVYETESSQDIRIDAGAMGSMTMAASSEAVLGMAFEESPGGVQVTTTFQKINASMSQPMGGSISASESDIEGDLVFTLDKQGKGTPVTVPEVKGMAEQLVAPVSFAHEFFPRLPGTAVDPGATWTDTIAYEIETSQGNQSSESIVTYTLVGDTLVDGVTLLHISYEGEADVVGSGMTGGTEVIQTFGGEVSGMFLWDPVRGVLVSGESSADMDGTVEVPAAGMPAMPMTVTGSGTFHLQGG